MAKLTDEDRREIIERRANGETKREVAARFGISMSQVKRITNRRGPRKGSQK